MIDQALVRTGFHFEILFSLSYFTAFFQAAIDSGDVTLSFTIPGGPTNINVDLRPPANINRDYQVNPGVVLPPPTPGSFLVTQGAVSNPETADSIPDELELTMNVNADFQGTGFINSPLTFLFNLRLDFDSVSMPGELMNAALMQVVNPRFALTVLDISGPAITALTGSPFNMDKEDIIAAISNSLPRSIPFLATGTESPIQKLFLKFHAGDTLRPAAIGIYMCLFFRLPSTKHRRPDYAIPDVNTSIAANFLPQGSDIAVAMSKEIFSDNSLGRHLEELLAEQQDNGEIDRRLKINYVKVFPRSGKLRLSINLRYDLKGIIRSLDPRGTLHMDLAPIVDERGLLGWETSVSVSTRRLARIFRFLEPFVEVLLSRLIRQGFNRRYLQDRVFASFIDVLRLRMTVASKRWDPFFVTDIQATPLINDVLLNNSGIGIDGTGFMLRRERRFMSGFVVRDKVRQDDGSISALMYRVPDLNEDEVDLTAMAPAADRLAFGNIVTDMDGQDLVELTMAQLEERKQVGALPIDLSFEVFRVHVSHEVFEDHVREQIRTILFVSSDEASEIRRNIKNLKKEELRNDITNEEEDRIRTEESQSLGSDATESELEAAVAARIRELVNQRLEEYLNDKEYSSDVGNGIRRVARLDLSPHEMGSFQSEGYVTVKGYKLVNNQGSFYYRDDRAQFESDSLTEEDPEATFLDNLTNRPGMFSLALQVPVGTNSSAISLPDVTFFHAESSTFTLAADDGNIIQEVSFSGMNHEFGHQFQPILESGRYVVSMSRVNEDDIAYEIVIE